MSTLPKLPTHHRQSFGGFWRSHLRRRPRRVSRGVASAARGWLGAVPEDGAGSLLVRRRAQVGRMQSR